MVTHVLNLYAERRINKYSALHTKSRNRDLVWASDITYLKLPGGTVYLVVILDLHSRIILSWRLSNTMDTDFCVEALNEALEEYGEPSIFNTDQGSQFTSSRVTPTLKDHHIEISMDSKVRALDNIYVERLWRSLKYEDIYIKSYTSMKEMKEGIKKYFSFYNGERFHQSLDYATPDEMYRSFVVEEEYKTAA